MSDLTTLINDFTTSMEAEGKSPRTISTYAQSVAKFVAIAGDKDAAEVTRRDIDRFLVGLRQAGYADTSVSVWFRGLQQFWKWAIAYGETRQNPMESYRQPRVAQKLVPVVEKHVLETIITECKGPTYRDRRDYAILMVFADTGCRLAEIAGLRVGDVNLNARLVTVTGKGNKQRQVPFSRATSAALHAYLAARRKFPTTRALPQADADRLWVAHRGAMTASGIYQVIRDRSAVTGYRIHPHQLRHSFIHYNLVAGMNEGDIQALVGWNSRQMFGIYGAAKQAERAQDHYRRRTIVEQLDIT